MRRLIWRAQDWWWRLHQYRYPDNWWLTRAGQWLCGRRGHTDVVWYNPGGTEPDMHCKRCGKDLG